MKITEKDIKSIVAEATQRILSEADIPEESVEDKMDRLYKELGQEIENVHLYANGDDRYLPDALEDAEYACRKLLVNLTDEWTKAIYDFFNRQ